MHTHVLQHVPFEGLGYIEDWLSDHGHGFEYVRLYEGDPLPPIDKVEFLISMGGPMSVNDEEEHPWLIEEKAFIKSAIDREKPILGICLGAQLIATAMGEKVYANSKKEIGWFPVQGVTHGQKNAFAFPDSIDVLHWHGETFDLPPEAIHLAQSAACTNQAFQLGPNAIGLQLHLEMKLASIEHLIAHCREEVAAGGDWVQTETQLREGIVQYAAHGYALLDQVLTYLTE